jgi:uncharacterized membrane protein
LEPPVTYVVAYIAAAVVFLGLDAIWLSRIALGMYRQELGSLLLDKPNLPIAAAFDLLYVVGIVVLAIVPALSEGGWIKALLLGAVLGLVAYGTYDITNLSTLKGWSTRLALIDIAWGTALTAVSAAIGWWVVRLFNL